MISTDTHEHTTNGATMIEAGMTPAPLVTGPDGVTRLDMTIMGPAVTRARALLADIQSSLIGRHEAARMAMAALLARQHMIQLGAPGSAKSLLTEEITRRIIDPATGAPMGSFIWLLTKFTTPDELWGPISVRGLEEDVYRRITDHKAPQYRVWFLDELLRGSSAILNTTLMAINERVFVNGPDVVQLPLDTVFAASNNIPQSDDLEALWDRFAIRIFVEYVEDSEFAAMLRYRATATPSTITVPDLNLLQAAVPHVTVPDTVFQALTTLRGQLRGVGVTASDRRWRWSVTCLQALALMEGSDHVENDHLAALAHMLWTKPDDIKELRKLTARLANPLTAKATELRDQAADVWKQVQTHLASNEPEAVKTSARVDASTNLRQVMGKFVQLEAAAAAQGGPTAKISQFKAEVNAWNEALVREMLGG